MTAPQRNEKRIGGTMGGRVQLERGHARHGAGALLRVRTSERPYRDASPGVEYPHSETVALLDVYDLAALSYLCARRLLEIRAASHRGDDWLAAIWQKAHDIHRPTEEKLAEFRAKEAVL